MQMTLYIHSKPDVDVDVSFLTQCISEIKKWMSRNFLCRKGDGVSSLVHPTSWAGSLTLSVDGFTLEFQTKL